MSNTASLKKEYAERIAPALKSQFQYSSSMQIPVLKKIDVYKRQAQNNAVVVVEDFSFEAPKTKDFVAMTKNLKRCV